MVEAHERYLKLKEIIEELEFGSPARRSPKWYDEHSDLMKDYIENLGRFSQVHPEETDPEFRNNCKILEDISTQLLKDYDTHQWFSLYDYLRYNKLIVWIVEYVCTEEELSELFNFMRV